MVLPSRELVIARPERASSGVLLAARGAYLQGGSRCATQCMALGKTCCFAMPSMPCPPGSSSAVNGKPRFVLKGGSAFDDASKQNPELTPPHSALVAAHARSQTGSKSRQELADQSPVRPLMSFDLKLTSSPELSVVGSSPSEATPMRQRAVNVGVDGDTPRRVRLITPRPNHQLFGRIYFDEKYQRDVRESENVENFGVVCDAPMLVPDRHAPAPAPEKVSPPPLRPVAKRPATPLPCGSGCRDSAATHAANERDETQPGLAVTPTASAPALCLETPQAVRTDRDVGILAGGAVRPSSVPPGLCADVDRIAHPGDDVEVLFPNDAIDTTTNEATSEATNDGAWYPGVLRARRRCDGAYGVLFGGSADWEPWAQWILMDEVNKGRLRRKDLVTVRAESVPLKLKRKLQNRQPHCGDETGCGSAQPKPARARPNVKLTVGGKRKRRKTTHANGGDAGPDPAAAGVQQVDENIVAQLIAMGFDRDAGVHAVAMTNNASLAAAADFLLGGTSRRGRAASKSMRET